MTIFALSSGPGLSGVAVIRISGEETSSILKTSHKKRFTKSQSSNSKQDN